MPHLVINKTKGLGKSWIKETEHLKGACGFYMVVIRSGFGAFLQGYNDNQHSVNS